MDGFELDANWKWSIRRDNIKRIIEINVLMASKENGIRIIRYLVSRFNDSNG